MPEASQQIDEGGILAGVARGSEVAMKACIDTYGGLVWSIVIRHCGGDRDAAEDVVQEVFTDLWRSADRFDPAMASEKTFVGLVARRRAIDFARKRQRSPFTEPLPAEDVLLPEIVPPTGGLRIAYLEVKEALGELPEETRQLIELHFDEGLTHPEIAEKTGTPLGTVKTRLRRGLIELRDRLRSLENQSSSSTVLA